jgi:error-prone DNA polymerase
VFACALLNSQPMGFYAPAQIVRDAIEHGVEVRPVDVNNSEWDCTLEPLYPTDKCHPGEGRDPGLRRGDRMALRLGLRQIKGLSEADAGRLVEARGSGYRDAPDLWRRSGLGRAALERLAAADALRSLDLDRRRGLWALKGLGETPLPLFAAAASFAATNPAVIPGHCEAANPESMNTVIDQSGDGVHGFRVRPCGPSRNDGFCKDESEAHAAALLPEMPLGEHVVEDYATTNLTIKRHPLAFLRAELQRDGLVTAADLATLPVGKRLAVAGLVLIRQRPGSANGVVFVTLEDETGIANLIVWPDTLERFRRATLGATLLYCRGRLQREQGVIHIVADDLRDWTGRLNTLRDRTGDEPLPLPAKPAFARPERRPGYDPHDIVIRSRDFR